ncbi:MAG: hypothetical protein IH840_10385 [Candidatus Heimdallarchaeota archaeon]|nr:hypothetical protein [Candidatus Heimdallarchaeota archaeon]
MARCTALDEIVEDRTYMLLLSILTKVFKYISAYFNRITMHIEDLISTIELPVNITFTVLSILIMFGFLTKFKGKIPWMQPNVGGFIFLSLGLSFHIIGHLVLAETKNQDTINLLNAFIAFAVLLFILGSSMLAYHNSADENKHYYKKFALVFSILGSLNVFYHFYVFLADTEKVFGRDVVTADLSFLLFEMISLTVIYVAVYVSARNAMRPLVGARLKLVAIISLGFVLIILVDSLLRLDILSLGGTNVFFLLFALHVLTVGSMYLLVFMPTFYRKLTGLGSPLQT